MTTPVAGDYTQRIVNRRVPLSMIRPHPENPNTHSSQQIGQLEESHNYFGQFRSPLIWQRDDGYIIVAGHGYLTGARNKRAPDVRADILPEDTPPELIREIMAADNLHGRNSKEDPHKLLSILEEAQELNVPLSILGIDQKALDKLYKEIEGEPMPEPGDAEREGVTERFGIIIECESESEQTELLARFNDEGIACRALVL